MEPSILHIPQKDGYQTHLFYYTASGETTLGTILILHGMAEHHGRYLDFIRRLTREGFDVYTYDHRGHGTDKHLSELGHIATKRGASLIVDDALNICRYIKENTRNQKLAIFGHSMGSLILRCLLQTYDKLDCAIASSSTMPSVAFSGVGILLTNVLCLFQGTKKRSAFLHKAIFGGKAYTSLCTRTTYDWLTRNDTIIDKYMDDPYCGFICTTSFYRDLTTLVKWASIKRNIAKTRRDIPLLLLTGDKDPVGGYGSQISRLHSLYKKLNFTNTTLTVYPEARHELLNELNAEEVYNDIITYFHSHLN